MTLSRLYEKLLVRFIRITFRFWQRLGIHITRCHYYEPIPDIRTLDDVLWRNHSKLIGIDLNEKTQLSLLSHFKTVFSKEYSCLPRQKTSIPYEYYKHNGFFEAIDGEILYCMIRHFKPKRIIEVGSGYSTCLAAKAVLDNTANCDDYSCKLIAIEPFPNRTLQEGFPGLSSLVQEPVQKIPFSEFEKLQKNDMLLIDSSHVNEPPRRKQTGYHNRFSFYFSPQGAGN